jgi:hypothetical protein
MVNAHAPRVESADIVQANLQSLFLAMRNAAMLFGRSGSAEDEWHA